MTLEDLMVRDVVTVSPEETVINVARAMRQNAVGCVVIAVEGAVKGIVTDRDLLGCIIGAHNPSVCRVSSHMSRPVVVLSPHEELRVAADVMRRRRIKRIPIAQAGRLLGLISFSDISRIAREQAKILLLEVSWIKDLIEERPLRPRTPVDHEPGAARNRQGG